MPKIGLFVEINNNKIEQYKNNNNKKNRNKGSVGAAWMLRIPTIAFLSLVKEKLKIISHAKHGEQRFDFANFSSPWFDDEDSGILATGHCR